MTTFSVIDETFSGSSLNTIDISFNSEEITLKDIITARVEKEVEQYNSKATKPYLGLVTPTFFEKTLNNLTTLTPKRLVDCEKQTYIALDGFLKNQFFVFINETQIESLDAKFKVNEINKISFIKLTPLVGG
jgi:hypothetical protein